MKASKRLMKLLRLAAFTALLGLVAAGCGPNDDTTTTETTPAPVETTPAPVETTPVDDAVTGGEDAELEVITGGDTGGAVDADPLDVTGGDTGGVIDETPVDVTGGETGDAGVLSDATGGVNTDVGVVDEDALEADATGGAIDTPIGDTGGTGDLPGETGGAEVAGTTGLGANATAEEQVQAVGAVITNLAQAAQGQASGGQ